MEQHPDHVILLSFGFIFTPDIDHLYLSGYLYPVYKLLDDILVSFDLIFVDQKIYLEDGILLVFTDLIG